MKQTMFNDKPPSYESLYQPTAPPLPDRSNHQPPPNPPSHAFNAGFSGCNPFCAPITQPRNSYDSSSSSYPFPSDMPTSLDHIPPSERKGVLWSGSVAQILDGGAKKIHAEILGSLTTGAMTIRTAGNKAIETFTVQLDVFLVHVPDEEVSLAIEKSVDSYRFILKTPKSINFKKKVRAYWLITVPDHWLQPEKLSASLVNSSIVGMEGLRNLYIGDLDLRTTNGPIRFVAANATNINLITTNAPVEVLNGSGDEIRIETTNGSVTGSLMAKDIIKVKTSNGAIETDANATDVSIATSNNHIKGVFTATKYANIQSTSGYIDVQVRCPKIKVGTTNGPVSGLFSGNDVSIKTTNAKMNSINVMGHDIKVQTSNGRIEGDFTAAKNITLKTSNSTVESNCRLEEVGGDISISTSNGSVSGNYEAPGGDIDISTNNAKIIPTRLVGRRIKLVTSNSSIRAAAMIGQSIKATTSHSPVELNLSLDDSDKKVDVYAETSHSAVNVRLPDTVIGTFDITTSHRLASVEAPNALDIVLDKSEKDIKIGRKVPEKAKSGYRDGKVQIRTSHGVASLSYV